MVKIKKNRIGIVIVNYNGANYQNECIESIYKSTYTNFDIVVVDSGSTDNSVEKLSNAFPDVKIIRNNDNIGVAAGNNIGIDYFMENNFEYIMLMNNDVEIEDKLIERLLDKADENTITVPKIYYYQPSDMLWFAGGELDWKHGTSFHIGINEKDDKQYDKEKVISYSPTCCMLIHRNIIEQIGKMDERYFMYYDDTDFCARVSYNENFIIKYIPDAMLWHKVSSSSGEGSPLKTYYCTRNKLIYMSKYKSKISLFTYFYTYLQMLYRYIRSPFKYKNYSVVKSAYVDYLMKKFYRKEKI